MTYSKVNWKQYLDSSNPTINAYLSEFGDDFIRQTARRIELAHKLKKPQIILFRFRDSEILSVMESRDYLIALKYLLNLCIKLEKYELCRDITNVIHSVEVRKKIKLIQRDSVFV